MISPAQIAAAAQLLQIAVPLLEEGLRLVGCAIEGCDVKLEPADAPDLRARFGHAMAAAAYQGTEPPSSDR